MPNTYQQKKKELGTCYDRDDERRHDEIERHGLFYARLGREPVFDDDFAACGCASDAVLDMHPNSVAGVRGGWQFGRKRRSRHSRVEGKRLSGYGSRIGIRKAMGPWRIKEDEGSCFFPHQIIDLVPHFFVLTSTQLYFSRTHPPLHDTFALDSGSEARYVRRQGRGLGIWPLLAARRSRPCGGMPGLGCGEGKSLKEGAGV